MIRYLKEENFEEEIKNGFILVDFYADWCGPCQRMGEILETMDEVPVLKVNVDLHSELASSYGIMSIPTMMLFQDGKMIDKKIGAMSKDELMRWIEEKKS